MLLASPPGNQSQIFGGCPGAGGQRYAYEIGLGVGQLKAKKDWEVRVWWQHSDQFSLDPNLVDSDIFDSRVNMQGVAVKAGYMLADAITNETGLVEMSYRCFIYYRSTGGSYTVSSRSLDGGLCDTAYDGEMVTADYLMGINYPASLQVRSDLQSNDNRPERRVQFKKLLPKVKNLQIAKNVITYTDPTNPLSIFGRWDLGYGVTDYPKQIPDGALDAKVGDKVSVFLGYQGTFRNDVESHGLNGGVRVAF